MKDQEDEKGWAKMVDMISRVRDPERVDRLLTVFLTSEERRSLSFRYLLVQALLEGELTQREIADKHGVSISKITRGSNALKLADEELLRFLRKTMLRSK